MNHSIVLAPVVAVFFLLCCVPANADRHEEIEQIRAELQALSTRLAALEAQQARDDAPPSQPQQVVVAAARAAAPPQPARWHDAIELSGDLRYRHEGIDQQGSEARTRHRVRARIGLEASIGDATTLGVRLASGGDNPVSTNQTLDDAGATKDFGLDRAYLSLRTTANSELIAGKMGNPLYQPGDSSLLWDSDYSPEGIAWAYEAGGLFATAVGLWIEERGAASDSLMFGAQAGYEFGLADGSAVTAGIGHYDYAATRGRTPFFDGNARGNTLDGAGNYAFDYNLTELFAEWATKLAETPFSVFANWVANGDASTRDTGWSVGGLLGKASAPGSWEFGYVYKDLEADAVVGAFTDSDIGGGGTAIRGHVLNTAYAFTGRIKGSLTYFISENRVDTPGERDYERLQADISVKY